MKKTILFVLVLCLLVLASPVSAEAIYDCHNDGGLVPAFAEKAAVACERFEHERESKVTWLYMR